MVGLKSIVLAVLVLTCCAGTQAYAITAEVAKACDGLVAKAFPPRQIGNPASGSAKGTVKDQRDYYDKCVANGGRMDNPAPAPATGSSK